MFSFLSKMFDPTPAKPVFATPRSPLWPKVRSEWFKEHSYCMACGNTTNLEVHHIKPFHLYPELELEPTNFITLCDAPGRSCHYRFGHGFNWLSYIPSVVDDVSIIYAHLLTKTFTKLD